MPFRYVYILQSLHNPSAFYVGCTSDLNDRLARHNAGDVPHTARDRPWRIKTAVAFSADERAYAFERLNATS